MNGENVFGWLKVGGVVAIAAALGAIVWLLFSWIRDKGGIGQAAIAAGTTLKNDTPFGVPARIIDQGLTRATGREETLGGWLAELFDPATRALRQLNTPGKGQRAEVTMARNTPYTDWQ